MFRTIYISFTSRVLHLVLVVALSSDRNTVHARVQYLLYDEALKAWEVFGCNLE